MRARPARPTPRRLLPAPPPAPAPGASASGANWTVGESKVGVPSLRSPATDLILHERILPFRSCLFVNHATPVHTQLKGWRRGGRWLRSREKPRSFERWSRLLLLTAEGHSKSGKLRRVGDERWKERGRPSRSPQFYILTLPFTELEVIYSLKWPSRTPPYTWFGVSFLIHLGQWSQWMTQDILTRVLWPLKYVVQLLKNKKQKTPVRKETDFSCRKKI